MSLEELQAQRQKLIEALSGTSRVTEFEGRRIERFSPEELLVSIAAIDAEIAGLSGNAGTRTFVVASSSGLIGGSNCSSGGDSYEVWR